MAEKAQELTNFNASAFRLEAGRRMFPSYQACSTYTSNMYKVAAAFSALAIAYQLTLWAWIDTTWLTAFYSLYSSAISLVISAIGYICVGALWGITNPFLNKESHAQSDDSAAKSAGILSSAFSAFQRLGVCAP